MDQSIVERAINRVSYKKISTAGTQTAEKAPVKMLETVFCTANDVVKTTSYHFKKILLTEMAHLRTFDAFFRQKFKKPTRSLQIKNAFTQQVIQSKVLTGTVAGLVE